MSRRSDGKLDEWDTGSYFVEVPRYVFPYGDEYGLTVHKDDPVEDDGGDDQSTLSYYKEWTVTDDRTLID